ncbi:hypothetical protein BFP71_17560 [Roseivirga misakiensis]|uniref:Pyruvate carboxyltransferase domain-containing protein n=1 Tax=Roseivirga misakiensis TaxID=1563681 RepID=A0A1E5T2Q1_9BACT|nr:hypothetical protein BFP71_17560 [Roseivirga misakiensis]
MESVKILDCTLRDGGYYTNWDFDEALVDSYLKSCESLPLDYLEIGYRSPVKSEYLGKYFYCPDSVLKAVRQVSAKKIAVLLNEKDVSLDDLEPLLGHCTDLIDLVRVAVNPVNFGRAVTLARGLKDMGYEVAFNVMYMSNWHKVDGFFDQLDQVNGLVDYFYLVDSFGGVYPDDVRSIVTQVKSKINSKVGFHGHNNMELGLINTLTAIEAGAEIVDATIRGMGRGAGNLKMELLLTCLSSKFGLEVDFNALGRVVAAYGPLQDMHQWGTNLPYMVSGANSLPQKDVMEWVSKRFYSMNSIVQALNNQSAGVEDNIKFNAFSPEKSYQSVLIIGGGPSASDHAAALNEWASKETDLCIVHASSKNANYYIDLNKDQFFCLVGNEGHRLEDQSAAGFDFVSKCILPPFPRKMGTYVPAELAEKSFELQKVQFTGKVKDSHTVLALQTAIELGARNIYLAGYDGYSGDAIRQVELEMANENETLFLNFMENHGTLTSLTPTKYESLSEISVYAKI